MYCLVPEKALRLAPQWHFLRGVYGTFYLAIGDTFYEAVNLDGFVKSRKTTF